jgi:proteic killer suppression protein
MIQSYKNSKNEKLIDNIYAERHSKDTKNLMTLRNQIIETLDYLDGAQCIEDLMLRPGLHFEALSGDRKQSYSIRVNRRWRICFNWKTDSLGPENVEIVDYH